VSLTEITNIALTSVIAIFAVIQGYSAYIQVKIEKKRNEIKAVSDELEKAYGPIHAILSRPLNKKKTVIELHINDKLAIDEKLSIYHSIFSSAIVEYWEKNIRHLKAHVSNDILAGAHELMSNRFSIASGMVDVFDIPLEFVEMFNSEYKKIVQKQRKLLAS
jgi:hypothetical protein